MTARNMVRDLRDSGALPSKPPAPEWITPVLLTVIALACGVVIAYLGSTFLLPMLSPASPPATPAALVADADPAPPAPTKLTGLAYEDTSPFAQADAAACTRLGLAAVRKFDAAKKESGDINMFGNNNGTQQLVLKSTELICDTQTRPMRFCNPDERTKLIDHAQPYLTTLIAMNAMLGLSAASPGLAMAPGNMVTGMIEDGAKEVQGLNSRVVAAFRKLAQRGLIAESDFNGLLGAPAELKAAFTGLGTVKSACA